MAPTSTDLTATAVDFDPFAGPELIRLAPITEPQAEIWMACRLGGNDANRAYNESVSLRLTGPLNRSAMEQAVQTVVQRHESLRSAFSADGRYILVFGQVPVPVFYNDLSPQTTAEKETVVRTHTEQEAQHVFDLVGGPLFKVTLFKLTDTAHHLTLTAHHIVCDGWSLGIMLQDLSKLYSGYVQNGYPNLPDAPLFSQDADEQEAFRQSDTYHQIEQFWVEQYKNDAPVLSLPTDFPRPALRTYRANRLDFELDKELVLAVKKMGLKAGCSFVTTLLAAFEVLLHRLTGQETVVVGLPAAGQSATGNYRLVGHCVNLLPMRSHPGGEQSFLDFLKARKSAVFDAYDHQRLTFGSLLQKLNISRDPSRVPLVPVVFNIDMGMADDVAFYGLTYQLISNPRAYENFELFLNATGSEQSLVLEWSYNTQLFTAGTITRMMTAFERLLRDVVSDPTVKIKAISLTDTARTADQYSRLNATVQPYPAHKTLHGLIAEQAQATPDAVAVAFGSTALTYRHLNEKANQFARYLLANGVQPGDKVGLLVDRSADLLIALLAILKCGAAYIPLDPAYPADRLNFMLNDSGAAVLITSAESGTVFQPVTNKISLADGIRSSVDYPVDEPVISTDSTQLAYVLYTSGSTGKPKGVKIAHYNLVNFLCSMQREPGISAGDRLLAITTISFDIAGLELFLPLITGATVVVADADTARNGEALLELLKREKITVMQATPSTWRMMLETGWVGKLPLKVLCGGEALSKELAGALLTKCDSLWNMYGPTETTIWSSVSRITAENAVITIGRPIANTQLFVLDEALNPVETGGIGELFIAGDGVGQGYLNRPEITAERFIDNPFAAGPSAKLYRTGDLGKLLDTGELQCLGRIDQQVKVRGYRIEPGEIESILKTFEDVKEAVVVAREERPGDQRLVAFVVPTTTLVNGQFRSRTSAWKDGLHQQLPAYMVPAEFVGVTAIPVTPNGKTDRNALLHLKTGNPVPPVGRMRPRTDVEKMVADIWAEYLTLDQVSITDDFFELGGHSLIAVQVMNRLEKETGKRLPLATLFEHSTVEKLALMLQMDGKSITWDSLVPIKPQGRKTPLYIVHGAGLNVLLFNALAKNMDPDQPVYGLQAKGLNGVDEPLDTIEAIAGHYVDAITAHNPGGPYALAGYSFGGIIAFEMNRQLVALGKEVKLLAMFDTYAYQSNHHEPWYSRLVYETRSLIKKLLYTVVLFKDDPKRTIEYKTEQLKRRLTETYWKVRNGEKQEQEAFFGYSYKLDLMNELAWRNYRLVPYPVTVELFRAKKLTFYMDDFEFLGWKPFALNGVNVHEIPGEHNYIFAPPNDQEFARILQATLDKC